MSETIMAEEFFFHDGKYLLIDSQKQLVDITNFSWEIVHNKDHRGRTVPLPVVPLQLIRDGQVFTLDSFKQHKNTLIYKPATGVFDALTP